MLLIQDTAAEEDTQIVDKIISSRIVKRKICARV